MESFFQQNADNLRIRPSKTDRPGLRRSQVGAIHSISSHFTLHPSVPALVVMPTGTGKTAVITMTPFILEGEKVLVLTSSKLVRGQITEEFRKFKTVAGLDLFETDSRPIVFEKRNKLNDDDIDKLNDADVVIGIPKAIDLMIENEVDLDPEYFDVILVDEAHHRAARIWSKVIAHFPKAKKVLFTATPFRRDKKLIDGKIIYNYPLSMAKEDGSFAKIEFHPANGAADDEHVRIAKKAEEIFRKDRKAGLKHYLMVRTNKKSHAEELIALYKKETKLRLELVTSNTSFKTAKKTIERLKDGEFDGIVCVDMLGEGFDFPNLKIAAIHAPHKSEAITLQFIGRFTRTNAKEIGAAKFIALPSDLTIGKHRLYEEGAAWQDLIVDLSEAAVGAQVEEQEVVSTFEDLNSSSESADVTLYNIAPYFHVKILNASDVKLDREIDFGKQVIEHKFYSKEHSLLVVLTRLDTRPKWISSEKVVDREYFLYAVHFDKKRGLLFINSSVKSEDAYESIYQCVTASEEPMWKAHIPKDQIHRVLLDLEGPNFFSVGMLNRMPSSGESYKTITGSSAEKTIKKTDGVLYENGHMFCGARENGTKTTVGYSSASKVWSNKYENVAEFLKWCAAVGKKIRSNRAVKTNSGFDHLPIPQRIEKLPSNVVSAFWGASVYEFLPDLQTDAGAVSLSDLDIVVTGYEKDGNVLRLKIVDDDELEILLKFSLQNGYEVDGEDVNLDIGTTLNQFMNSDGIILQTADLDTLVGPNFTKRSYDNVFDVSQMSPIQWDKLKTDITVEFGSQNSVQTCLERELMATAVDFLICDHGSGEAADFITATDSKNSVSIAFYHVKASSEKTTGDRLGDLYEVCGQVIKSAAFAAEPSLLMKKLSSRLEGKPTKFRKGTFTELVGVLSSQKPIKIKMVIVQPGISKQKLSTKLASLLSAPDYYLRALGTFEPIEVICSP